MGQHFARPRSQICEGTHSEWSAYGPIPTDGLDNLIPKPRRLTSRAVTSRANCAQTTEDQIDCSLTLLLPADSLFHLRLEPVVLDANLRILALHQPDVGTQTHTVMQFATRRQASCTYCRNARRSHWHVCTHCRVISQNLSRNSFQRRFQQEMIRCATAAVPHSLGLGLGLGLAFGLLPLLPPCCCCTRKLILFLRLLFCRLDLGSVSVFRRDSSNPEFLEQHRSHLQCRRNQNATRCQKVGVQCTTQPRSRGREQGSEKWCKLLSPCDQHALVFPLLLGADQPVAADFRVHSCSAVAMARECISSVAARSWAGLRKDCKLSHSHLLDLCELCLSVRSLLHIFLGNVNHPALSNSQQPVHIYTKNENSNQVTRDDSATASGPYMSERIEELLCSMLFVSIACCALCCASSVSHRHLMPLSSSLQASFGSICSPLCSTVTSTGGVKVWVRLKLDFGPTAQHCNQ
jgi:hypothetical protein